eukprot:TRINITY_DN3926_c0_g2_i1.p1 TRINITY_DN3926_c0_g2~~TRINITY_DN3926_c0_g2_i1.p1  ORF type:complete len:952 (-),score=220.26 TRINITY_DN3926_c0_g2_i1:26-2881(-)
MAPHHVAPLAWLHDPMKEASADDLSLLGALSDDVSILQMEAVSAFLEPIAHVEDSNPRAKAKVGKPVHGAPTASEWSPDCNAERRRRGEKIRKYKCKATVGKPVHGAPTASEWSQDFTAERRRCGDQIREYKFKVAKGYFVGGESFRPIAKPGFSSLRRSLLLTLPPQSGAGSGWMTSRPTSQECAAARARKNRSPATATFPALSPSCSLDAASPDLEMDFSDQQSKQGHRDRAPPFVNERPWLGSSPKPGLLVRKDYMGNVNPEVTMKLESKSQVPRTARRPSAAKTQASVEGPVVIEAPEAKEKPVERSKKALAVTTEGGLAALADIGEKDLKGRFKSLLKHKAVEVVDVVDSAKTEDQELESSLSLSRQPTPADTAAAKIRANLTSRKSVIWGLKHKDCKSDRLGRINDYRRMKASDANDSPLGYRNRISKADAEIALDSFLRHFPSKSGSPWNTEEMVDALADFGIQAQNKTEKVAVFAILKDFEEEKTSVGFTDFCNFIEECRSRLRAVRSMGLFQAWKRHDDDDSGTMDEGEVLELLEDMGLTPKPGVERQHVMNLISDATDASTGTITFPEVEYLMSSVREYMVRSRRTQERDIKAKECLSAELFTEFRTQLLSFYSQYTEMDDDGSGSLDTDEILNLLQLFGCLSNAMDVAKKEKVMEMVDRQLALSPTGSLGFAQFVRVIKNLRQMEMQEKSDAVQTLFNQYDKDKSGDLSIKEICAILMDLHIQPRSLSEQEAMAQLIDEADRDGSGELNVQELLFLVQRIGERVVEMRREEEYRIAKALNFSLGKVNEFRRAFDTLDASGDGYLSASEVLGAVSILRWKITDAKFAKVMEEVDEDGSGQLDFAEFLMLLRKADTEMNGGNAQVSGGSQKAHKADEAKDDDAEDKRSTNAAGGGQDSSGASKSTKRRHPNGPASSAMPGLIDQQITQTTQSAAASFKRKNT